MAFHFSLQSLLRFRQGEEQRHRLLLQAANLRVGAVRHQIETVNHGLAEMGSASQRELNAGVNAVQLHFNQLCLSAVLQRRQKLEEELVRCEKVRAQRSQDFQQARRQHEVLTTMRDEQFEWYREQQNRREQKQLDDMLLHQALLRRG